MNSWDKAIRIADAYELEVNMNYKYDPILMMNIPEEGTKTKDSSVNDFSAADAKAVFDYVDRQFTKDMNEYSRRIANAKTQDECERIEESIRKDLDNIVDEYIQIWNQVGQYAQKRKNDAVTRYGELMSNAFKKYNELGRK